ncbi:protein piccolo-like isoform X4 [Narcine bancroftii]|uniref:protein piccolo-like isoform X4 n=1 Tax=Narcine bancroftii TaxID=1343680 RepID=UPI0038320FB6
MPHAGQAKPSDAQRCLPTILCGPAGGLAGPLIGRAARAHDFTWTRVGNSRAHRGVGPILPRQDRRRSQSRTGWSPLRPGDSQQPLRGFSDSGEKQRSPGVDPKQLAAELQKVSQQVPCVVSSATEKGIHSHSGTTSAASSAAPSPGQPASPSVSKKRHSSKPPETSSKSHPVTGEIQLQMNYDKQVGNLIVHVLQARDLAPRENNGYSDPFVKVYLLPGRSIEYWNVMNIETDPTVNVSGTES